jgi:hypothetical protein
LHHVDVGSVADVLEVHVASIFRVDTGNEGNMLPPERWEQCPHPHGAKTHHKQSQYQEQTLTDVSSADVSGKATDTA